MHSPCNRTSWDKNMLKDTSNYNFYGRSQLVRLWGKYTVQTAHCAMESLHITTCQPCADNILIPLYWYVLFDWQSKTSCLVFYFLSLHTANFFCFSFAEMGTDQFNCSMVKIVQHKVQNVFVNTLYCFAVPVFCSETFPRIQWGSVVGWVGRAVESGEILRW